MKLTDKDYRAIRKVWIRMRSQAWEMPDGNDRSETIRRWIDAGVLEQLVEKKFRCGFEVWNAPALRLTQLGRELGQMMERCGG